MGLQRTEDARKAWITEFWREMNTAQVRKGQEELPPVASDDWSEKDGQRSCHGLTINKATAGTLKQSGLPEWLRIWKRYRCKLPDNSFLPVPTQPCPELCKEIQRRSAWKSERSQVVLHLDSWARPEMHPNVKQKYLKPQPNSLPLKYWRDLPPDVAQEFGVGLMTGDPRWSPSNEGCSQAPAQLHCGKKQNQLASA